MTNEEARKILIQNTESLKANPLVTVDDCLYEAFDMAIKALEHYELSGRQIERSYEMEYTDGYNQGWKDGREALEQTDVLEKVRAEIAEYGSIMVAYAITDKTKTDKGIEKLVTDVLSQAKRRVFDIIDKYREGDNDAEY